MEDTDAHSLRMFWMELAAKNARLFRTERTKAAKQLVNRVGDLLSRQSEYDRGVHVIDAGTRDCDEIGAEYGITISVSAIELEVFVFAMRREIVVTTRDRAGRVVPAPPLALVFDPLEQEFVSQAKADALRAMDSSPKPTAVDVVLERIVHSLKGEE